MKKTCNVYAPIYHLGKREVWTIPDDESASYRGNELIGGTKQ